MIADPEYTDPQLDALRPARMFAVVTITALGALAGLWVLKGRREANEGMGIIGKLYGH